MSFSENIVKIYNKLKNTTGGKNADYIKELSKVNPHLYAISIYTINGEKFDIGDYTHEFSIQSCSKIFTLALALEKYGVKYVKDKIGSKKSSEVFNSISAADNVSTHTINSFVNGGAMATTSLLYKPNKTQYIKSIVDNMSDYAGKKLHIGQKIYNSEKSDADHNLALAHLLKSYGRFYNDVHTCVDVYTKQCSVMVTSKDVALMACTLANGGVNPKTGTRLISKKNVDYIIDHMASSGLYDETDKWMEDVGLHAKSGVSGVLLIVVPGVMGISIFSPPLNAHGNSVKGIKTAKMISKLL
jgi:glutaminase